jgi:hypothetical protein
MELVVLNLWRHPNEFRRTDINNRPQLENASAAGQQTDGQSTAFKHWPDMSTAFVETGDTAVSVAHSRHVIDEYLHG